MQLETLMASPSFLQQIIPTIHPATRKSFKSGGFGCYEKHIFHFPKAHRNAIMFASGVHKLSSEGGKGILKIFLNFFMANAFKNLLRLYPHNKSSSAKLFAEAASFLHPAPCDGFSTNFIYWIFQAFVPLHQFDVDLSVMLCCRRLNEKL